MEIDLRSHLKELCQKYKLNDEDFVELVYNDLVHDYFWKQTAFMQAEDIRTFIKEEHSRLLSS